MKRLLMSLIVLLCMAVPAQAILTTIGTAEYGDLTCNLIYDDDDTGHGGGGLVWLDYTNPVMLWQDQVNWALGVGASLTVNLSPGYTTSIDWTTGWRLPDTVDGLLVSGYEGDPNNDGVYTYTYGHNLANSEMGHLFYAEFGNVGRINPDGSYNDIPPMPDVYLQNTDNFDDLIAVSYWSSTEYAPYFPNYAWYFNNSMGSQGAVGKNSYRFCGIAVHSGEVLFNDTNPVPEPATMLLLGTGLAWLAAFKKRRKG